MKRIRFTVKYGFLFWIFIPFAGNAWGQADAGQMNDLLQHPTITYEKPCTLETTEAIWVKVLDHPLLVASLWKVYGFQPAYQVSPTPSGIHVMDPSGIVGDVSPLAAAGTSRRFYGSGNINHWAIPSFFSARGIIQFQYRMEENLVRIRVKVFMKGSNAVSDLLIKAFSGTLLKHIDRRITNHMTDMQTIAGDITRHPEETQKKLTGQALHDFNRLFM